MWNFESRNLISFSLYFRYLSVFLSVLLLSNAMIRTYICCFSNRKRKTGNGCQIDPSVRFSDVWCGKWNRNCTASNRNYNDRIQFFLLQFSMNCDVVMRVEPGERNWSFCDGFSIGCGEQIAKFRFFFLVVLPYI